MGASSFSSAVLVAAGLFFVLCWSTCFADLSCGIFLRLFVCTFALEAGLLVLAIVSFALPCLVPPAVLVLHFMVLSCLAARFALCSCDFTSPRGVTLAAALRSCCSASSKHKSGNIGGCSERLCAVAAVVEELMLPTAVGCSGLLYFLSSTLLKKLNSAGSSSLSGSFCESSWRTSCESSASHPHIGPGCNFGFAAGNASERSMLAYLRISSTFF